MSAGGCRLPRRFHATRLRPNPDRRVETSAGKGDLSRMGLHAIVAARVEHCQLAIANRSGSNTAAALRSRVGGSGTASAGAKRRLINSSLSSKPFLGRSAAMAIGIIVRRLFQRKPDTANLDCLMSTRTEICQRLADHRARAEAFLDWPLSRNCLEGAQSIALCRSGQT